MHRTLKDMTRLAICITALGFAIPAFAQTHQEPPPPPPVKENNQVLQPVDCKKNPLIPGCPPQQKYPQARSKEDCNCEMIAVKSGKRTLWVRNCYVQLPKGIVYYCKNPVHNLPKK